MDAIINGIERLLRGIVPFCEAFGLGYNTPLVYGLGGYFCAQKQQVASIKIDAPTKIDLGTFCRGGWVHFAGGNRSN